MKRTVWFTRTVVALTWAGLALPQLALAEVPARQPIAYPAAPPVAPPAALIADVALAAGGVLKGLVVDPQGIPLAATPVVVRQQESIVATAVTDRDGHFTISSLPGGVYSIAAGEGAGTYRLWAEGTAPPAAQSGAMVVSGQRVVRGQGSVRYWLTNPWILAGLIGAAIAVPIALNNRDRISTS